jgi:hypothetical protein
MFGEMPGEVGVFFVMASRKMGYIRPMVLQLLRL